MIGTVLALLRGHWLPVVGAAAIGLLAWQWHSRGQELEHARIREALISETAIRNAAAVDAVKRDADRNVHALEAAARRAQARARDADDMERRLRDAPTTRQCLDSPAVSLGLDELRRRAAARAAGGPEGSPADPGKPADLR